MSSTNGGIKKRKANDSDRSSTTNDKTAAASEKVFEVYSLEEIRLKIQNLCPKIPDIPESNFILEKGDNELDEDALRDWASQVQAVVEEFNLLVFCVATATYKWGTDRSGAADQNLSLLSGELGSSQEHIASAVTPRLTNVLAPVVDLVIEKIVKTTDENGDEIKERHFTQKLVDPEFLKLCYKSLARNAPLLRHVVLSNFSKSLKVLKDFLEAQKNDTQHSRGFTY